MLNEEKSLPELKVNDEIDDWKVIRKLGEGGCGTVFEIQYIGKNYLKRRERLALKVESRRLDRDNQLLRAEANALMRLQFSRHCPRLYFSGKTCTMSYVMMELLGQSLSELRKSAPGQRFPVATVLKIALQTLSALHDVHRALYVHRDVKPGNFAVGLNDSNRIFILDFGLARPYAILGKNLSIREPRKRALFRGTLAYCSINVHKRLEQGRHDDLCSMMYMLIEFTNGALPWKRFGKKQIALIKETTSEKLLLQKCPKQFGEILHYLEKLNYWNPPDYSKIEELFMSCIRAKNIDLIAPLEWCSERNCVVTPVDQRHSVVMADLEHSQLALSENNYLNQAGSSV